MHFFTQTLLLVFLLLSFCESVQSEPSPENIPSQIEHILPPLIILETIPLNPTISNLPDSESSLGFSQDGGDFLRSVNGLSAGRFGGRGLDPVIRGQSQTRINVELDSATVHGGCPNRMDPPTSWAALNTYETVVVEKGIQSLSHGSGGSGGRISFSRDTLSKATSKGIQGYILGGGSTNGLSHDTLADFTLANESSYLRILGEYKNNTNYRDGHGNEILSSFDHLQSGIIIGTTLGRKQHFELGYEHHAFHDALYPGAGMDSPKELGDIFRIKYDGITSLRYAQTIKLNMSTSLMEHEMNNFSLRTPPPPMRFETITNSDTTAASLSAGFSISASKIAYGINIAYRDRDATLYNRGKQSIQSYMWPDTSLDTTGLFLEATTLAYANTYLTYGIRIDSFSASAATVNDGPNTSLNAYQTYYGAQDTDYSEIELGGLFRGVTTINQDMSLLWGLSRSARPADETERYMNKWVAPGSRWIGNPSLDTEIHHQADLGFTHALRSASYGASLYYTNISDYILRESARGQNGVLQSDGSEVYVPIDARIYGLEIESSYNFSTHLMLNTSGAWLRGDNTTGDRPLPQMPPFNATISLDYLQSKFSAGLRFRCASAQNRIDTLSLQEAGETPGYGVCDLYGEYKIAPSCSLYYGIDNVLDHWYTDHLSRSDGFSSASAKVAEPGRTFWLKSRFTF